MITGPISQLNHRGDPATAVSDKRPYRVAIPLTPDGDGIAKAIFAELQSLGHSPQLFPLGSEFPVEDVDVYFLFGPFGKFLHIPQHFAGQPRGERPRFIYWNTEGLPDLRLPWSLVGPVSHARSWAGRLGHAQDARKRALAEHPPFSTLEPRLKRYRYIGDYLYAHRQGWMDVFADISAVYSTYFRRRGIPAIAAPFGSFSNWHADLNLKRDIDVLWMGKRATKRREGLLQKLRGELRANGVEMYVIDNVERPFVHDEERTEILNRTKITLNLLRTWYDENSLRICLAAPNRSLVVSEPLLPHVPEYQPGVHYVSASVEKLAQTILYYLRHEEERLQIVKNAYRLSVETVTFRRSMQMIMEQLDTNE